MRNTLRRVRGGLLTLREATRADCPFINLVRNHYSTRIKLHDQNRYSLKETYEWFDLASPFWLIIEDDQVPVGYVRTSRDLGESIWVGVSIHVCQRRKGYAEWAYRQVIQWLIAADYKSAYLEVSTKNHPALQLYRKLGFKIVSTKTTDDADRQFFVMRLRLSEFRNLTLLQTKQPAV